MTGSTAAPRRPPWSLFQMAVAGMVLSYVWRIQQLFPLLAAAQFTSLVTLLALGLLFRTRPLLLPSLSNPVYRWTVVILGLMILGVPLGIYPGLTFRFIVEDHLKTFLLMVLLVAAIRSSLDLQRFMVVHVVGALLYSGIVMMRIQPGADGRLPGAIYYDANDVAMVLVCTLPLAVYLFRPGTAPPLQLIALAAFGLSAVTIVRTGSRGGFLSLMVVLAYLLFTFDGIPRLRRAGALAAMVLALGVLGGEQYWQRIGTLLNPSEDYNWADNGTGRVEIWKRGLGYMAARPILGVGASAFYVAEGTISELAGVQQFGMGLKWSAAHNSFVQIGAELGVLGLVAFVLLLWNALSGARAAAATSRGTARAQAQVLGASLLGFAIAGFFLSQAYSAYLYTLFGLLIAQSRLATPSPPRTARPPRPC